MLIGGETIAESDLLAAAAGRAEMQATGEEPIPREQVKADLGLT